MMHLVLSSDAAVSALAGGAVLGVSTIAKLVINGNILGISGIVNGICGVLVEPTSGPWGWRVAFTAGFLVAGAVLRAAAPQTLQALPEAMGWVRVVSAGALVGLGSSLGNGCTSGHGISGITRLSPRSIAATATFMATGILTASLSAASSAFTTTTATAEPAEPPLEAASASAAAAVLIILLGALTVSVWMASTTLTAPPSSPSHPARLAVEFTVATAFGLALGISGMGRPEQVLAFLDVSDGTWDPTLALVMGGALCVTLPLYHIFIVSDGFVRANCGGEPFTPFLNAKLELPTRTDIDRKLILGAALFGGGWGLAGVCPGPALIGALAENPAGGPLWRNRNGAFLAAMLIGTTAHKLGSRYLGSPKVQDKACNTAGQQGCAFQDVGASPQRPAALGLAASPRKKQSYEEASATGDTEAPAGLVLQP